MPKKHAYSHINRKWEVVFLLTTLPIHSLRLRHCAKKISASSSSSTSRIQSTREEKDASTTVSRFPPARCDSFSYFVFHFTH